MKMLHYVAFTLVLVGALNWGLLGLTGGTNLVHALLTTVGLGALESLVYVLVGASAVWAVVEHQSLCKACKR